MREPEKKSQKNIQLLLAKNDILCACEKGRKRSVQQPFILANACSYTIIYYKMCMKKTRRKKVTERERKTQNIDMWYENDFLSAYECEYSVCKKK